ncbi:MAG: isopentenyl-diphosphate Delta-isomerase [PVC group bacterium]|nr:isopentenyl-diphosphate Delta-isomerase [PVC group bacterium]
MEVDGNKVSFLDEKLILVDDKDNIIGYETKEKSHKGNGILHRAFSIFIFDEKKQLLLQKRSAEKLLWPLFWSNSVCSHPREGESCEEAVQRRLQEELGLKATLLKFLFKFKYQAQFKDMGSENELCSVYLGKTEQSVKANPSEIAEWKYVNIEKLSRDVRENSSTYTPWFKIELKQILREHQADINGL